MIRWPRCAAIFCRRISSPNWTATISMDRSPFKRAADTGRNALASRPGRALSLDSRSGWLGRSASPDIRSQLEALAPNPKLVGIRHIVQSEPDDRFLLQPDFLRGISVLEEFDLAYDILIYTKHLPVAAEFVERFPRQRFVLDHLAKPPIKSGNIDSWAHGIGRLAEFPNVFCKLSGLVTEADWQHWEPEQIVPFLDVAFESFGSDRLMIGSDWPVCLVAASYARAVEVVKSYILRHKPECQEAVLGGNAQRFWRLTRTLTRRRHAREQHVLQ